MAAAGYGTAMGTPDGGLSPPAPGGYSTPPAGGFGPPPPMGGAGMASPVSHGGLQLAPQELEYYQQLLSFADPSGRGVMEGGECARFLYGSGVPQDVLRRVWEIADRHGQGFLNTEGFFVALRLVAHAQAGQIPDPQLVTVEPTVLPDFPGLQRRRAPSEVSPPPGSGSPSIHGGGSEFSELQPVIAGEEQLRQAATAAARTASRSASPKPFTRARWAPSRREKRKYASLFKRTDWDGDGYVLGSEAEVLLERSRLPRDQLMVAWEHSDRDRDGRLDFREFVCLVHIVTCVLRGAQQPGPAEELPPELINSLMTLEPLEVLAAEREASRSRSRSASPMPSQQESPDFLLTSPRNRGREGWSAFGGEAEGAGGAKKLFDEGSGPGAEGFGAPEPAAGANDAFGFEAQNDAFANEAFGGFDAPPDEERKEKDKKEKKHRRKKDSQDLTPPPDSEAAGFGALDGGGAFGDFGAAQDPFATGPALAEFGGHGGEPAEATGLSPAQSRKQLDAAVSQFEAMVSADQQVSRQLRREVDELDQELIRVQDAHAQMERQMQLEQEECTQLDVERRRLEGQVRQARQHFAALQEERRSANIESLSLRRDRDHFVEESNFLRRMAADEEGTLEVLRTANQLLERSQRELEAQTEVLERERKDVLRVAAKEKEQVQQAERQNAELRNRLERLRREKAAALAERQEASLREERVRDMQSHGVQPRKTSDGRPLEPAPSSGKHTWATGLLGAAGGGTAAAPAAKLGSSASAGPSVFAAPLPRVAVSREGV
uniref:Calmodulin n=1 Tax=Alexandrium monilatum TaxID=311494 RepID=A0A7S4WDN0_9DINO